MSFQPGDMVVCISTEPDPSCQPHPWTLEELAEGACYRVAAYFPNHGTPGLQLIGIDHRPGDGWHAWRFRKVVAADHAFSETLRMPCLEPV